MKKAIFKLVVSFVFLITVSPAYAQMMSNAIVSPDDHTAREEVQGKEIWQRLQNKEIECTSLSVDDFSVLGEYFMGQMIGASHPAMNQMMTSMMGEKGEEQAHIVIGKRLSGCDAVAEFPPQVGGFMPMMQMMAGGMMSGTFSPFNFNNYNPFNTMMNFGYGFSFFGIIFMLLWWALIVVALIALIKWLISQPKGEPSNKTPLDILKERYARGEIDKKEFEEKRKLLE